MPDSGAFGPAETLGSEARRDLALMASVGNFEGRDGVLLDLASDSDKDVRVILAGAGTDLPRKVCDLLSKDADEDVRAALAQGAALQKAVLERLSRDASPRVRAAVALRSDLPAPICEALAADLDYEVRESVAAWFETDHPAVSKLSVETLSALAQDGGRHISGRIGLRHHLRIEVLRIVAETARPAVLARRQDPFPEDVQETIWARTEDGSEDSSEARVSLLKRPETHLRFAFDGLLSWSQDVVEASVAAIASRCSKHELLERLFSMSPRASEEATRRLERAGLFL